MRNVFFSILFLLTTLLCSTFSYAGNEHEHLQYLPRYEDIQKAMGGKLGVMSAEELFTKNPQQINQLFGNIYSVDEIKQIIKGRTLRQLCEVIATKLPEKPTALEVQKSIFELGRLNTNKTAYSASGAVRNKIFTDDPNLLIKSVSTYLEHVPKSENIKTIFSVPDLLLQQKIIVPLQQLFQKRGLQAQFLLSIPRSFMLQGEYPLGEKLSEMRKGLKEDWIAGIDISGSIHENAIEYKNPEKMSLRAQERLKMIFNESKKSGAAVRLHVFESAKTGIFYDAFWRVLEECKKENCLPATLRIGHIQELDPETIAKFTSLKNKMPIIFEANIESNLKVQASEIKKLSNTIEKLHQNGFRVVLGADGRGILGESSAFESTLTQLKDAGMSEASLKNLIKDAHLPIRNTRIDKKQLLEWQKERLNVQNRVLGVPMQSSGSCPADFMKILRLSFKNAR